MRLLTPAAAKATDENLTSEDWGAIIEVCDKVSGDPNGAKEAVQSMIKRLAHRNANVQLYTLEVCPFLWLSYDGGIPPLPESRGKWVANQCLLSPTSLRTPCAKTAGRRCIAKSPAVPLPKPC